MIPTNGGKYDGEAFKGLDLAGEQLTDTIFMDCQFINCNFADAQLVACRFADCQFTDCNLRLTQLKGTAFSRTTFTRCGLLGIDWTMADWSAWSAKLGGLTFDDCDLKYSVFVGVRLPGMKLIDCNATEANFAETDLTDADLQRTDLTDAVFLRTNLTRANFVGARGYRLSLNDNKTSGATFSLPEAVDLLYHLDIVIKDNAD